MDKTEHCPVVGVAWQADVGDCICDLLDVGSCRGCSSNQPAHTAGRQGLPLIPGMPTTTAGEQPVNGLTSEPVLHTGNCSFGIARSAVIVHGCRAMYLQVCQHMLLTPKTVSPPRPRWGGLGRSDHICPGLCVTAGIQCAGRQPHNGCMPLGHLDNPWPG